MADLVIVFQSEQKDSENSNTVIKAFETRSGIRHQLSCVNPSDPDKGNCPIKWEVVFLEEKNSDDKAAFDLIESIGAESF